jgi:CRP-like cAMP-binding protein
MLELLPGDQFLLASDGLHGYINHNAELEPYFEEADGTRAASELIDLANNKGGKDNITAVLVRVGSADTNYADKARKLAAKRQALAGMPLFSKLQERELLRVMQVAEVLKFSAGEEVMREGERGDELFIVIEGTLQIVRGEQVLSEVGPGEHFGEMALIRSSPRSATVRAIDDAELIAIRRADFFAILRKEYELAVKLLWQFLGVLADRLDQTSRDLSTAKEELAAEDITDAISEIEEEAADAAAAALLAAGGVEPPQRRRSKARRSELARARNDRRRGRPASRSRIRFDGRIAFGRVARYRQRSRTNQCVSAADLWSALRERSSESASFSWRATRSPTSRASPMSPR